MNLHRCLSIEMFRSYANLASDAWFKAGVSKTWTTFSKSYITDNNYNRWFVGSSGISSCTPNNNSNERNTQILKGTKQEPSSLGIGHALGRMLGHEWPKTIHSFALKYVGVKRHVPIDNKEIVFNKSTKLWEELSDYTNSICSTVDIREVTKYGTEMYYFLNTEQAIGVEICLGRMERYHLALKGVFLGCRPHTYNERKEFINNVETLCKVTRRRNKDGVYRWRGSCYCFLQTGYCHHAAYMNYRNELVSAVSPIPISRGHSGRCRQKGRRSDGNSFNLPIPEAREMSIAAVERLRDFIHNLTGKALSLTTLGVVVPKPIQLNDHLLRLPDVSPLVGLWKTEKPRKTLIYWKEKKDYANSGCRAASDVIELLSKMENEGRESATALASSLEDLLVNLELLVNGKTSNVPLPIRHK